MECIACHKSFKPENLLTVVVDPKDLTKSIRPSPICESCYSLSGIGTLAKRFPGYRHTDSLHDVGADSERALVEDRETPVDTNAADIARMQNEVAALQTLDKTGGSDVDHRAIQAKIMALKLQLSIRTSPAQRMDRRGLIE